MDKAEDLITLDAGISDDILRCYDATVKLGFNTFGLTGHTDTKCITSKTAEHTYKKLGKSTNCRANGIGANNRAQVYKINRKLKESLSIFLVFFT
jgi:hypothetical protein